MVFLRTAWNLLQNGESNIWERYLPTPADSRGGASEKRLQAVGAVASRPGPYFSV